MYFTLDFVPTAETPNLALVALGLSNTQVGDLDVHVWDRGRPLPRRELPVGSDVKFASTSSAKHRPRPSCHRLSDLLLGEDAGDPTDEPPGGNGTRRPRTRRLHRQTRPLRHRRDNQRRVQPRLHPPRHVHERDSSTNPSNCSAHPPGPSPHHPKAPFETPRSPPTPDPSSIPLPDTTILPDRDIAGIGSGINEQFDTKRPHRHRPHPTHQRQRQTTLHHRPHRHHDRPAPHRRRRRHLAPPTPTQSPHRLAVP